MHQGFVLVFRLQLIMPQITKTLGGKKKKIFQGTLVRDPAEPAEKLWGISLIAEILLLREWNML